MPGDWSIIFCGPLYEGALLVSSRCSAATHSAMELHVEWQLTASSHCVLEDVRNAV